MNSLFQPTVSIFTNGIVINYKKVGTRFLQTISTGVDSVTNPINASMDNHIDFQFFNLDRGSDFPMNSISYKLYDRYVYADWHWNVISPPNQQHIKQYSWKTDEEFLKIQNVNSYTEFFFENKKDIIFVIRNPLLRFFSGLVQDLQAYLVELRNFESEFLLVKKYTDLSDDDILSASDLFGKTLTPFNITKHISSDIMLTLFRFFLTHKWDLILQDVHTEPYLLNFREMIYHIRDISKVKIVDLSHLSSTHACNFFCELRGDEVPRTIYADLKNVVGNVSNFPLYNILLESHRMGLLDQRSFDRSFSVLDNFIGGEQLIYNDLINSPYFINLAD